MMKFKFLPVAVMTLSAIAITSTALPASAQPRVYIVGERDQYRDRVYISNPRQVRPNRRIVRLRNGDVRLPNGNIVPARRIVRLRNGNIRLPNGDIVRIDD